MNKIQKKNNKISASTMAVVALMTAVLCVLSPFSIPIGPIPISLATLGFYMTVILLGRKKATVVCLLYLLMGLIGLPVFAGFSGGPMKLFGPTGGYLLGYLLLTIISGWIVDKFPKNRMICLLGFVFGTISCYIIGTVWLAYQMKLSLEQALLIGVVPFLIGDVIKIGIAVWFAPMIRKRVVKYL